MKGNPNEPPTTETTDKGKLPLNWWQYPLEYIWLLKRNPRYRLYLLSHICQHVGDWYVRIASLLALDRLAPGSATAISLLILTKMGPHVLLPSVGGALADTFDRRIIMMVLDSLGAMVTLGFVVAIHMESLSLFYVVAALRATVHSLYEPATKSIVPMLVCGDSLDLKRAMTLNGLAWSFLIMVGGVIAGQTAAILGVEACFVFDSITYFLSAMVLCLLRGNYQVEKSTSTEGKDSTPPDATDAKSTWHYTCYGYFVRFIIRPMAAFCSMSYAVLGYLHKSGFGMAVLLKSSGSVVWGAADILNVEYAHVPYDEGATSERLGLLFSCIGLGCLLGPMCANLVTDPDRLATLQLVCIGAISFMMSGWIGFASSTDFTTICIFTTVRSFGSSIIWVNSSLLLQRLSIPEMMGRVLALEFASMMFFDALSAMIAGRLLDTEGGGAGVAKTDIAVGQAILAATLLTLWTIYHMFGKGAARRRFNRPLSIANGEGGVDREAHVVFA
jgi:hypothetical protein